MVSNIISPIERPGNLDKIVFIQQGLSSLEYFGPYNIDLWFYYEEITPDIQRRFDNSSVYPKLRDPFRREDVHQEIYRVTAKGLEQFLTPPYPVEVDIHFSPQSWTDGEELVEQCRLFVSYHMSYFIKLQSDSNEYYIAKEPQSAEVVIAAESPVIMPDLGFRDGLPLPCLEHHPYVETCAPRIREIMGIVEGSGLPKIIEEEPKWSDILRD